MVNFDLRKLSAPLEELRPEVEAAYKRLDQKWESVTAALRQLPIPCDIGYTFSESPYNSYDYVRLEWRKWKGKKRICVVSCYMQDTPDGPDEMETVTPYDEWSGEQRIAMLQHVPDLFDAAAEQIKTFISRTIDKGDES